jgi:superfamily I DNA and/or RNA helicase
MAEFVRTEANELYIDESNIIPIIIKYNDNREKWHNAHSETKFQDAIKQYEGIHDCFFVSDGISTKGKSPQPQVIIMLDNTILSIKALIEGGERSFYVLSLIDEGFIVPNDKSEYVQSRCNIRFIHSDTDLIDVVSSMSWGQRLHELKDFITNVAKLPRPLKEIRKEEDQAIWKSYSDGLDALTKAKQELQKIKKVGKIHTEVDKYKGKIKVIELEIEALNYPEMLRQQLMEELQDYPVIPKFASEKNGKACHIIFDDFRQIPESELQNLNSAAEQSVYRINNPQQPSYKIEGVFSLRATSEDNQQILSEFEEVLRNYDDNYPSKTDNIYSFNTDKDISFALEQIEQRFGSVLKATPSTKLVCSFISNLQIDLEQRIRKRIGSIDIKTQANFIVISSKKAINIDEIESFGLSFDSCRIIVKPSKFDSSIQVPAALSVNEGYYQAIIADKTQIETRPKGWAFAIPNAYKKQGKNINCQISEYTYAFRRIVDKESLKALARILGNENKIIIKTALGKAFCTPLSIVEYDNIKERIRNALPVDIIPQFDDYKPIVTISFLNEVDDFAHNNFIAIQNALNNYDLTWNESKDSLSFSFVFEDEEKRESVKSAISEVYRKYQQILNLNFSNSTGQTIISFHEDSALKVEREKDLQNDFARQSVNLVPSKFDRLLDKIESADEEGDWNEKKKLQRLQRDMLSKAEQIGTCKQRTSLTVKIEVDEEFLNKLEDKDVTIKAGDYIQFPLIGESMNVLRQKEAMDRILTPGVKNRYYKVIPPAINPNLSNFLFDPRYAKETESNIEAVKVQIRERQIESNMNDRQCEAVAKAIEAQDIAFIQGPPGTGKTTVIAEIIWQEVLRNPKCKILLTSQTNLAVDNALERLQGKRGIRPIRIAKSAGETRLEREGKRYLLSQMDNWSTNPNNDNADNATNLWIDTILNEMDSSEKYADVISQWKKDLTQKDEFVRTTFTNAYTRNVNLVAATCSICGARNFTSVYKTLYGEKEEPKFDVVIMDEASKATPLEMAIPMVLGRKVIVIGDHKQLPPMVDDDEVKDALRKIGRSDLVEKLDNIKESQFKRLFEASQKMRKSLVATLDTQYRMHEQIMNCISHFYKDDVEGGLKCGIVEDMNSEDFSNRGSRYHGLINPPFVNPNVHAIWVDVDGKEEKVGTSTMNRAELRAIERVLNNIRESEGYKVYLKHCTRPEDKEIGIITFYGAQAKGIKEMKKEGKLGEGNFRIDVVDKFQGMERNIVVVSTVRTASMGFAQAIERINVAFSRAKKLLIVVGDKDFFAKNSDYRTSISAMEVVDVKQLN